MSGKIFVLMLKNFARAVICFRKQFVTIITNVVIFLFIDKNLLTNNKYGGILYLKYKFPEDRYEKKK